LHVAEGTVYHSGGTDNGPSGEMGGMHKDGATAPDVGGLEMMNN